MILLVNMIKSFLCKIFPFVLIFAFCVPTFIRILQPGFFPMHDDFHIIRTFEMDKCLEDFQIPCRWVPDMGFGYGYPEFNYYAPLPYYIMEAFHLLGVSYIDSVKVFIILVTFLGALGMYFLSLAIWKNKISALFCAFLFTYLPYRAVDIYVRGALPEIAALAVTPFVILYAKNLFSGLRHAKIWFSISLAFLLATHTLSVLIVLPFVLLWVGFLFFKKIPDIPRILDIAFGFVLAIGLAAFFVMPALFEKNYVHIDTLTSGYFNYLAHFVSIKQLLFSTHWGFGFSEIGVGDDVSLAVGIPQWIAAIVGCFLLLVFNKRKNLLTPIFFVLCGFTALFLTHEHSSFIWNLFPTLSFVQFPWRFLLISGFFFSLAAGVLGTLNNSVVRNICVVFFVSITFFLYQGVFAPKEILHINDNQKLSGSEWTKAITASIYDYLPIWAPKAPDNEAPSQPVFVEGQGDVMQGAKHSNSQEWKVQVTTDIALVELPTYFFPNWKVFVNGREVPNDYQNQLGILRVELGKGDQNISLKLQDTPVRTVSNIVSFGSVLVVIFLFCI